MKRKKIESKLEFFKETVVDLENLSTTKGGLTSMLVCYTNTLCCYPCVTERANVDDSCFSGYPNTGPVIGVCCN